MKIASLFFLLILTAGANAATVIARNGNIEYQPEFGWDRQITSQGIDYEPSLSADGKLIVFARILRSSPSPFGQGVLIEESQLCVARLTPPGKPIEIQFLAKLTGVVAWASMPQLSRDNRMIYFLVPDYSAVAGALFSIGIRDAAPRRLAQAQKYWTVPFGYYRDNLIVWQHPLLIGGGRYDIFNMIKPTGELVGVVGFSESQVTGFLMEEATTEELGQKYGKK